MRPLAMPQRARPPAGFMPSPACSPPRSASCRPSQTSIECCACLAACLIGGTLRGFAKPQGARAVTIAEVVMADLPPEWPSDISPWLTRRNPISCDAFLAREEIALADDNVFRFPRRSLRNLRPHREAGLCPER
jgi:hypothetical protein